MVAEFSYQAMAMDLTADRIQGEQVTAAAPKTGEKPTVLDERDSVFAQARHLFISEATDSVVKASRKFAEEYGANGVR